MSQIKVNSIVPSGGLPSGANGGIIQTIYVQKSDTFSSSNSSWIDIPGLTATITPSSASNKILVICHISGLNNSSTGSGTTLARNGSHIGLPQDGYGNRQNIMGNEFYRSRNDIFQTTAYSFLDSPATTSAVTYKVRLNPRGNSAYINRSAADNNDSDFSRGTSDMLLMEIST